MQKTAIIFVFVLTAFTTFAQTQKSDTTISSNSVVEQETPEFGIYDDLADMKKRFKDFVQTKKVEKEIAETPQDELLWEAAKGPQDFEKPKMINAYSVKKPVGYASSVKQERVDKEDIRKTIQASLILSKSTAEKTDDNWQLKLKKK